MSDKLDLDGALIPALERNDLLPPRPDDRAGGEIGDRFVARIKELVTSGRYEADRAVLVSVPKQSEATRPAALLTAADRVMLYSLVEPLRSRIERRLVSSDALMWPRAEDADKRWSEFEAAPLSAGGAYIVVGDVAGFYESIDHDLLGDRLVELTGRVDVVSALVELLGQLMGSPRGLPQGLAASDVLATAYLSPTDASMLRFGYSYWRHGDDIRVTVKDHDDGRLAVHRLEASLRSIRLLLNGSKTRILKRETFEVQSRALDEARTAIKAELVEAQENAIVSGDIEQDALADLVQRAGIEEETQWAIFYHERMSVEEIIEDLRPHLQPNDITVARRTFAEAVRRAPDSGADDALGGEVFHGMLSSSLTALAAADDPEPLPTIASLILRFPSESELLATYLRSLASLAPETVAATAIQALNGGYSTGWQQAWLFGVVRLALERDSLIAVDLGLKAAVERAQDEEASWLSRAEAVRLLGTAGQLELDLARRLWAAAPAAIRVDIAVAVSTMAGSAGANSVPAWAEAFRDTLREDPLLDVVLHRAK